MLPPYQQGILAEISLDAASSRRLMSFDLTAQNAVHYLVRKGLVKASEVVGVEHLGWGISNTLVKVRTADGCLVVKQSLPQL